MSNFQLSLTTHYALVSLKSQGLSTGLIAILQPFRVELKLLQHNNGHKGVDEVQCKPDSPADEEAGDTALSVDVCDNSRVLFPFGAFDLELLLLGLQLIERHN